MIILQSTVKFMQEILSLCENRRVLFDNKTKDEFKRAEQVQQLLSLVNMVIVQNGGKPYTDELFVELQVSVFIIFGNFVAFGVKLSWQ